MTNLTPALFDEIMKPLCEVFAVPNAAKRLPWYYQHLQSFKKQVLIDTVREWMRSEDRFPTINQLAERAKINERRTQDSPKNARGCHYCDDLGLVGAKYRDGTFWAFKCHCSASASVSTQVTPWFGKSHPDYELVNTPDSNAVIERNALVFRKGLLFAESNGVKLPKQVHEKIVRIVRPETEQQPQQQVWDDCPF